MIYVTGDTHGDFTRFHPDFFPEQRAMTREDYVLIAGDFGGLWDGHKKDRAKLDRLEALPFTTLFVDGNHENFDLLQKLPVEEWQGGKVHFLRPHVLHLMRGQVFALSGRTFFTLGGASSHDISDGILNPASPSFREDYGYMKSIHALFRVEHRDWWRQELPSPEEYQEARRSLDRVGWQVDHIITHCAPTSLLPQIMGTIYTADALTDFLEEVRQRASFRSWVFGHYHDNRVFHQDGRQFALLLEQIVPLWREPAP